MPTETAPPDSDISYAGIAGICHLVSVAPKSWLPALLIKVTAECVKKGVFRDPDAIARVAKEVATKTRDGIPLS